MTTIAGEMLVSRIMPIILGAIAGGAVRPMDTEDVAELQQDCVASAAAMLDAVETQGKPMKPSVIAYYALQRAKTGRRSMSAGRTDVLSPGTILDGNSAVVSMDALLEEGEQDDADMTLHDVLEGRGEGPDVKAARDIDWGGVMATLPAQQRKVVRCTAEGYGPSDIGEKLRVSAPRIVRIKREVAARIREAWGDDAVADVCRKPVWRR